MHNSDQKILASLALASSYGEDEACRILGVKHDTIRRYKAEAERRGLDVSPLQQTADMAAIRSRYSDSEVKALVRGARVTAGQPPSPQVDFSGDRIRVGYFTDTHIGSIYCDPGHIFAAFKEFERAGVDMVCHSGDVVEGMSNRAGHVFECSSIGYHAQRDEAVRILKETPAPLYVIDGNHDRWYIKSGGGLIVPDICNQIEGATFVGHDVGDINLGDSATLRLHHGEDGNSYAVSYRVQKIVESLTGGEKPNVLFLGHVHKSLYLFDRHVHCFGGGSIQKQSAWMRGKRIPAHTGFWIIDIYVNESGVAKVGSTWHPFYQ